VLYYAPAFILVTGLVNNSILFAYVVFSLQPYYTNLCEVMNFFTAQYYAHEEYRVPRLEVNGRICDKILETQYRVVHCTSITYAGTKINAGA